MEGYPAIGAQRHAHITAVNSGGSCITSGEQFSCRRATCEHLRGLVAGILNEYRPEVFHRKALHPRARAVSFPPGGVTSV